MNGLIHPRASKAMFTRRTRLLMSPAQRMPVGDVIVLLPGITGIMS
jgi:hypothetical protein